MSRLTLKVKQAINQVAGKYLLSVRPRTNTWISEA